MTDADPDERSWPDEHSTVLAALEIDDPILEPHLRRALVEAARSLMPVVVLALDGGGVRGIFQAQLVLRLLDAVAQVEGAELAAGDVFDLFAGTSTGGVIAGGLAAPTGKLGDRRDRPQAIVELYRALASEVFPQKHRRLRSLRQVVVSKYNATRLERLLAEHVGDARLSQSVGRVLIPAYDTDEQRTQWFDSAPRTAPPGDPLLREVLRATSAAPTYFSPAVIDGRRYVDGGVGANNPTLKATAVALQQWADDRRDRLFSSARRMAVLLPAKVVVISVGNGSSPPCLPRIPGIAGWGSQAPRLFGHSSGTAATELAATLPSALREFSVNDRSERVLEYVRIEPRGAPSVDLDDARQRTFDRLVADANAQADVITRRRDTPFERAVDALTRVRRQRVIGQNSPGST